MKRQVATAIAVYRELEPQLHGRQLFVRQQLELFLNTYPYAPTALELLRFVSENFPTFRFDPNSVRPRLRELWEQGWVQHGDPRPCRISGKRVLTWQPSMPRVPVAEPVPQRLEF